MVIDENLSFREAEKKIIGVDHTELGAMIAKMWKFSPKMVSIIRHHHLENGIKRRLQKRTQEASGVEFNPGGD